MDLVVNLNGEDICIKTDEDFVIDEGNIDGELCKAGRLLCFYGNLAAELKAQAVNKKSDLERLDAEIAITLREKSRSSGEKITEGGIREKILTDINRKERSIELTKTERDFNKIENLYRSQQKKVDCVIALAYKQRTEIARINYS